MNEHWVTLIFTSEDLIPEEKIKEAIKDGFNSHKITTEDIQLDDFSIIKGGI